MAAQVIKLCIAGLFPCRRRMSPSPQRLKQGLISSSISHGRYNIYGNGRVHKRSVAFLLIDGDAATTKARARICMFAQQNCFELGLIPRAVTNLQVTTLAHPRAQLQPYAQVWVLARQQSQEVQTVDSNINHLWMCIQHVDETNPHCASQT